MIILRDFDNLSNRFNNIVITIGNFDGVHLGHQKILKAVKESAIKRQGTAAVLTFEPHPSNVLRPSHPVKILTPLEDKIRLIEDDGIDVLLCLKFDKKLADMEARDFIKNILVKKIGVSEVIVGHDYHFGKGKRGTTEILRRYGEIFGFLTKIIRTKRFAGEVISSTKIRNLISHGKVSEALQLLGRPYTIYGTVIKGKGRGEKLLEIPTANIETDYELIPARGVYVVKALIDQGLYGGVMNIGENPTFGEGTLSLEVHILDFSGNLLGSNIKIFFLKRLRGEKKFPDVNALRRSILNDIDSARKILKRYP